ncbi:hypothetical protein OB08_02450 [Microbacterium sp. HJ5]
MSRIWRLALVGAATAFAWVVLSLLLGLGSGHAHAEDADDGEGLLGAVTSVVDETASAVTGTVTGATAGVTEVVNTVVEVAPAPVQQPVRQVVQSVGTVVQKVTQPVVEVVSDDVVGAVTDPVVEVVTQVPVVGDIVTGIGADKAVEDLADTVDETLGGLTGAVEDTGAAIGQPSTGSPVLPPVNPALPRTPAVLDEPAAQPSADGMTATAAASGGASALLIFDGAYEPGSAPSASVLPSTASSDARGPLTPAGGLCPPSASSSGPGGAGPGAWALVAFGPLAALRAWGRRAGPEDEHAPPAPAGSTDVSPD